MIELAFRVWVKLAQSKLSSSAVDRYMLGIFLASVSAGNRRDARQALNVAATDGKSVGHWIARLDAKSKAVEAAKDARKAVRDDPVLGTWRIVSGDLGKQQWFFNSTFRADGRAIHTPVIKAAEKAAHAGTWRKRGDGRYVVTFSNGRTAQMTMGPAKEGMRGKTVNGLSVDANRQAKSRK